MNNKVLFHIEVTDTFSNEANYSWVRHYKINAKSYRGAIRWLSRNYAKGWRQYDYYDGTAQYRLKNACICCFISQANE